jgi:hypothetical protein
MIWVLAFVRFCVANRTMNSQGASMDLQEQRLNFLRMAYELGGKTEPIIAAANAMMNFVLTGASEAPAPALDGGLATHPEAETPAEPHQSVEVEPVPAVDPIAACGTALVMPEGGDLAAAEPAPAEPVAEEASPPAEAAPSPVMETIAPPAEEITQAAAEAEVAPAAEASSQDGAAELPSSEVVVAGEAQAASAGASDVGQTCTSTEAQPSERPADEPAQAASDGEPPKELHLESVASVNGSSEEQATA